MDRRLLRKVPSLLGQRNIASGCSNNNPDKNVEATRPRYSSLKATSQSSENNLNISKKGSPVESKKMNITSQEVSSEDSDENKTFITNRKRKNKKKLESSKNVIVKRLRSSTSYTDLSKTPVSEKKKTFNQKSSVIESPPIESYVSTRKSISKLSRESSITRYSAPKNSESDEEEETEVERAKKHKATSQTQLSRTEKKHSNTTLSTPKKKIQDNSLNKKDFDKEEITDDDMFNEASPAKSPINHSRSPKWQSTQNNPQKKKKTTNITESQISKRQSQYTTITHNRDDKSPTKNKENYTFKEFLKEAGIIIAEDGPNSFRDSRRKIIDNLNLSLSSKKYDEKEFIEQWQCYIDNVDNLQSVLSQAEINDPETTINWNTESVARILLHVPSLQTGIATSLLDRLATAVLIEDSPDNVPWSGILLRQLKFLEQVVDPNAIITKLEELLEMAQRCFQAEIISYLPEIVIDGHHRVGEILTKLLDDNTELTAVILDCISQLMLSKDHLEQIREKTLDLLQRNPKLSTLPVITRFILGESSTKEDKEKTLKILRSIDMRPLAGENLEECFTNQVLTINALRTAHQISKQIAEVIFTVVQGIKGDPKPLDLIMLLLVYTSTNIKKKIETLLKKRIRSGVYRASLLNDVYYDYKEVARDLQFTAILLATQLLKLGDRVYVDFAIEWFRLLFLSQKDAIHKQQEVLAKVIKLAGSGTETSKNALAILSKIASKEDEREHLQKHSHHLRILLEAVDELDLEEVATVSDLLHGLCVNCNSTSEALQSELDIILSKQLASSKPLTKCKGVLGALTAVKHAASYPRTTQRAIKLFEQVVKAVISCFRSRALFYDQMAGVVANTQNLDDDFLKTCLNHFKSDLDSYYLKNVNDYSGPLTAQFSINSEVKNSADEAKNSANESAVHFGEGQNGSAVLSLFKVIKTCHMRTGDVNLSEVNALLGCPIFMPKDLQDPNPTVLDQTFHCINWFRELISGFVIQPDDKMQRIVLKRLEHLMSLQTELSTNLTMAAPNYQPPVCYFYYFPSPPFVKIEKKSGKRGNKTILDKSNSLSEWASWKSGSALVSKNPAYFRRLDTKIAHLLDFSMEIRLSQSKPISITKAQVCFIIKELLGMLENEVPTTFMKELVGLLPKVCAKLEQVTSELRDKDDDQNRECLSLLLRLLVAIYNWKGFHSLVNNNLLKTALRILASQTNEENMLLRSCSELITPSCSYIESLVDIATRISVAVTLVNLFQALIQHSEGLAQQHKTNLAKLAFGFLCLYWSNDRSSSPSYKVAVKTLLNSWIDNEPDSLDTVVTLLKWLPEEAKKLSKSRDSLAKMVSIDKKTFSLLFNQIFIGLTKGVKLSLLSVKRDSETIQMWNSVATSVQGIIQVCQAIELKESSLYFLKYIPPILKLYNNSGIPVLGHNLKYHREEVQGILKQFQEASRYLNGLCFENTVTCDTTLAKYVPGTKSILEQIVYSVKGMLVMNNSQEAFWMGNLINKDTKGQRLRTEINEEESTVSANSIQTDDSEKLLTDPSEESTDED